MFYCCCCNRFYSKTTGELICELEMPEPGVMYEGCSELLLSGLQNCIYTEDQVYHIKVGSVRLSVVKPLIISYEISNKLLCDY